MAISTQLTVLRAKKDVSLQFVANAVGVSKTHIWELEKGKSDNPTLELIRKLADFYDVSTQFIIGDGPESSKGKELALSMFRKFGALNEYDQKIVSEMVDSMLKRDEATKNENQPDGPR